MLFVAKVRKSYARSAGAPLALLNCKEAVCKLIRLFNVYNLISYLGVAQFGSAQDWGSWGRWFKSSHSDQLATCFLVAK